MARDEIKECNNLNVPLKDFKATFCDRCMNVDCVRSGMAGDKFSKRTSTWVERLFTDVRRMDPSDPRFSELSAQRFVEVPGVDSRVPEINSTDWVDPLQAEEERAPTTERMPEVQEQPAPPADQHNLPIDPPRERPLNTPERRGIMIESPSASPTSPTSVDPWEASPKPPPAENVVKRGARIQFSKKPT